MARNFCSHTPRSSGWAHWKAGNFLLKFKKNPDEKYFFIMEKFDFEKIFWKYFSKLREIHLAKNIFLYKILYRKIFFAKWISLNFEKYFQNIFSKSNFSMIKKYFSSGFFLNFKRKLPAFQCAQPELLGVCEQKLRAICQKKSSNL